VDLLENLVDVGRVGLSALLLALLLVIRASCGLLGGLACLSSGGLCSSTKLVKVLVHGHVEQDLLAAFPPVAGALPPVEAGALDAGLGGMLGVCVRAREEKREKAGEWVRKRERCPCTPQSYSPLPSLVRRVVVAVLLSCCSKHAIDVPLPYSPWIRGRNQDRTLSTQAEDDEVVLQAVEEVEG
jgi:hypothetical protein